MNKFFTLAFLGFAFSGCGGSDGGQDSSNGGQENKASKGVYTCDSGVEMPKELVGTWTAEIQRGSSLGQSYVVFTSDCTMDHYEIGDYIIMDEWMSDIASGATYKFSTSHTQKISEVRGNEFYVEDNSGEATIVNIETNEIAAVWDISSLGAYHEYSISDSGEKLNISISINGQSFGRSYDLVK